MDDIMNKGRENYYGSENEKEKDALIYFDKLLPFLPEYSAFMYHEAVKEYLKSVNNDNMESRKVGELEEVMERILEDRKFATRIGDSYQIKLTEKGSNLKKAGSLEGFSRGMEQKNKINYHHDNSLNVGGNFTGNLIKDNHLSKNSQMPATIEQSNQTASRTTKNKYSRLLKQMSIIVAIAAGLITVYEFVIKKFFH